MIPRIGAMLQKTQHKQAAAPTTSKGNPNKAMRPNMPYKRFLKSVSTIKAYAILALMSIGLSTSHADNKTSRLGLTIPDVGSPQWGTKVNNNFQILDSTVNINGGGGGAANPGGITSQVQFNNSGTFGGANGLTYNTSFGVAASTVSVGPSVVPTSPSQIVVTSSKTLEAARFQCNGVAGGVVASQDSGCVNLTLNALSDGFVISAASQTNNQSGAYLSHEIAGPNWNEVIHLIEKQGTGSNPGIQIRAASQAGIEYVDTTLSHNLTVPAGKYKTVTRSGTDAWAIAGRSPTNSSFQSIMDFYREGSVNSWTNSGDANVVINSTAAFGWTNYVGSHAWLLRPNPTMTGTFLTTLPAGYGTNGQAIVTDGAGNWSFQTISGSSSTPVVVQSSGIAFGSSTNTVTSDSSSLFYQPGTKTIGITHAASGGSYLIANDTNVGNNTDYILESDNGIGVTNGFVAGTNAFGTGGGGGITISDGSKNEVARFGSNTTNLGISESVGSTVGISTMNVAGNMTIGGTYAGAHSGFTPGYVAPPSGLAVEGQTVLGTTTPVSNSQLTVNGSMSLVGSGNLSVQETDGNTYQVSGSSVVCTVGQIPVYSSSFSFICATATGGTPPGGNPYDVQVDSNGIFGGYDNFQNNGTTVTLSGIQTMTQNNVVFSSASGVSFGYSGSSITLGNQGTYNVIAPLDISGGTGEFLTLGDSNPASAYMGVAANPVGNVLFRAAFGYGNGNAIMQGGVGRNLEFDGGSNTFGAAPLMYLSQTGNLGIGVGSGQASAKLQVSSGTVLIDGTSSSLKITSSGSANLLQVSTGTAGPYVLNVSSTGHINSQSIKGVAVTTCGTSPTISSGANDVHGTITVGSGTPTSCTVTFGKPYASAPDCVIEDNAAGVTSSIGSQTATAFTVNFSLGMTGSFAYICIGSD